MRAPALDALRGLAVALVFVSHAANDGLLPGWLGQGSGQMGVQLFFALSGFLMMRLYGAVPPSAAALRRFAVARAARILPLYWTVAGLSLAAALAGLSPYYRVAEAPWAALLMLQAPQELWSVPVEVQFYAVFALACWRIGPRPGMLLGLLAASVPGAAAWYGLVSEAPVLPPYLPYFLGGCWVAALRLPAAMGRPAVAVAALLVFGANLPGVRAAWGGELWAGFYPRLWLDPARLAATLCLLACAATLPERRGGWLGLARLGRISFGVYLFHRPLLAWSAGVLTGPLAAALALALTLGLAALSWRYFERPLGQMLRAAPGRRPRGRRPAAG